MSNHLPWQITIVDNLGIPPDKNTRNSIVSVVTGCSHWTKRTVESGTITLDFLSLRNDHETIWQLCNVRVRLMPTVKKAFWLTSHCTGKEQGLMAHSHCTGPGPGQGPGNDGFLYYALYCSHYTGTGTGNHCFLLYLSRSRSRSRAVWMSHYTGNRTGTIRNNGSWSLSLFQISFNISAKYIRIHWSRSCSQSRTVWIYTIRVRRHTAITNVKVNIKVTWPYLFCDQWLWYLF